MEAMSILTMPAENRGTHSSLPSSTSSASNLHRPLSVATPTSKLMTFRSGSAIHEQGSLHMSKGGSLSDRPLSTQFEKSSSSACSNSADAANVMPRHLVVKTETKAADKRRKK